MTRFIDSRLALRSKYLASAPPCLGSLNRAPLSDSAPDGLTSKNLPPPLWGGTGVVLGGGRRCHKESIYMLAHFLCPMC